MKYIDVLSKLRPTISPFTDKTYIALVDNDTIKEKVEIDVDFWLAELALAKSYALNKLKAYKIQQGHYEITINIKDIDSKIKELEEE